MKKQQNFLTKNYSLCWKFLGKFKQETFISVGVFILAIILGLVFPSIFREQIMELMKTLAEEFIGLGVFETIIKIFLNNSIVAFFTILLGVLFGIFPLLTAIVNGYVIGFVVGEVVSTEGILVLWKLFPHGIFELPAIILAMGIGLRLGKDLFSGKNLRKDFRESMRFFLFVILPLLLIASIIEGTLMFLG